MKIVLIGGHLSPVLSVLQALPKTTEILFLGRKYGLEGDNALSLEYETINALNIPFVDLNTARLQRKLTKHTIPSLLKLPFGIVKSFLTLIKFKPNVVVGFGGYISIPVVFCAYLLRIPIVIHEQTLEAGFANRFLAKFATRICISWQASQKYFPKDKTVLTGNPIRKFSTFSPRGEAGNFLASRRSGQLSTEKDKLPMIYITGGSSGSHFINTLVEGCLEELLRSYNIIHQTGDAQEFHDFDRLAKIRESLSLELRERYEIKKFIDPRLVGSVFGMADLVVGRSGINTITELIYFEKPSLLIPLPFSQNNEQLKNAKFLKSLGLAEVFYQDTLDSKKFLRFIVEMFNNIDKYKILKRVQDDKGNAAQNIIDVINYVYKNKTTKSF